VEIGQQVHLVCPWTRHLTGLLLPLSGSAGSNRWQLASKTENDTSLSLDQGILTNK